jgi:hypothetical protein
MSRRVYSRLPDVERFWPKVDLTETCWLWTAGTSNGYGNFRRVDQASVGAHTWAFEQQFGPIPSGMCVLHVCDVRACVRNDEPGIYVVNGIARPRFGHLFLSTKSDNTLDMWAKGRGATGDRAGARTKPESLRRGENHPARQNPEIMRPAHEAIRAHPEKLARGERNGVSKLTIDQVIEIRRLWIEGDITQTALAARYGVTQGLVGHIVRGVAWRHLL